MQIKYPYTLFIKRQCTEDTLLLHALLEQDHAVYPFPLLHKNLPFDAKVLYFYYTPKPYALQQGMACLSFCGYPVDNMWISTMWLWINMGSALLCMSGYARSVSALCSAQALWIAVRRWRGWLPGALKT